MKTIASVEETKKRLLARYNEIKKVRKRGELTHDIIAKECNISVTAVNKWFSQKDTSLPELQNWVTLAELLDCDVDYLLGLQDVPRKEYSHIAEMTGLSYEAAGFLAIMANDKTFTVYLETVSDLLIQMKTDEASSLLLGLSNYIHTDYLPDRTEDESLFTAYQKADMLSLYGRLEAFANKCRDNKREAIT